VHRGQARKMMTPGGLGRMNDELTKRLAIE
jgi:hypothetical protein